MGEFRRDGPRRQLGLASEIVGREEERAALLDMVASAARGWGGVGLVLGEAGIGKSRLAQVATEEAELRGMKVLRGRAVPTTTPVPYRPLAEALTSAVRHGAVRNAEAPELAPFRPSLGRLVADWHDPGRPAVDDSVVVLAESVLRFLRSVANPGGCLVVLEDLHWADAETLAIVEYLADHVATEPVLLVATARNDGESPGLDMARALHARRIARLVVLGPLDRDTIEQLVASCLGTQAAPEVLGLAARAEGVPFLVEELLAAAVSSGALVREGATWTLASSTDHVVPLTFADSVRRRLAALGDQGPAVLGAAAILGRGFDWELLAAITAVDESSVAATLRAAVEQQLLAIDPDGGAFRFRHALTRDAVLAELLPPERARLSDRALAAIEATRPGLPGPWCELAAEVAQAAGDRQRAAALLLEGGRRGLAVGALATAELTLERARTLVAADDPAKLDVDECLATVLALAGKRDRAVEVGEALLTGLGGDPASAARRAQVHLRLARAAVAATRWAEADEQLERAASELESVDDDGLRARIDVAAAHVAILRRPEHAASLASAALEVAERLDLRDVACEALEIIGRFERSRDLEAAEGAFARAHGIAAANELEVWRMRALHEWGTIDLLRAGGLTRLAGARELSLSLGAPATTAVIDVQVGAVLTMADDPEPGAAVCRRAADLSRRYRLDETLAAALAFEGVAHARAGRRTELEGCLAEAVARAGETPEVRFNNAFASAHLAWVDEDRPAAVAVLQRHTVAAAEAVGVQTTGPNPALLALLLAVDGDHLGTARWLSQPPVHFLGRAFARYARAVLAGRAGDGRAAVTEVARGDQELGGFNWYRHYGHRLVAEAAVSDGWADAGPWLLDALAYFNRSGDTRIASACRSLLRRAGSPVPRQRSELAAQPWLRDLGITAREAEVLRLLALGLSNQGIGTRLYLSARTVERHIASLTTKAGVSRRAELVAFAARTVGDGPNR